MWEWRLLWIMVAVVLLLTLVTACGDWTADDPPEWRYSCLESVKVTEMKPLTVGGVTKLELVTTTVCVKSEYRCTWGPEFKGQKKCPPRKE